MRNFKKVLSLALALLMVVGCVVVAPVETKAATNYELVTSVEELKAGDQFVMLANYDGKYYVGGDKSSSSGKVTGYKAVEIQLSDLTSAPVYTLETGAAEGCFNIKEADGYLAVPKNGNYLRIYASLTEADTVYDWAIEAGTSANTFRFYAPGTAKNPDEGDTDRYIALNCNNMSDILLRQYANKLEDSKYSVEFSVYKLTDRVSIADALATEEGTVSKVKGVVTCIDGKNVYIQDATGGIDIYLSAAPTDLAVGDTIEAEGSRATYRGLPELTSATYVKSAGLTLEAKETTIDALTAADICTYVTIKGLTVTEVYDNNGSFSLPNITVTDGTNTIQLYKAAVEKDENGAWAVKVDDVIDVVAAVGTYYETLQLRTTSASDITVVPPVVDDGNDDEEETTTTGGTVHYVNAYDWTATSVYAFVSDDTTQNANTMTGQSDGTFEYWTYVVLDQNEDGNYEVTAIYPPAPANEGDSVALQEGRVVVMMHDSCADATSYAFFTGLAVGDVLSASASWTDMKATWGALDVDFAKVEEPKGIVHHVNAYDWTATSIYAFVSADTTQNVNTMTGQADGTFEYFTYIVLDQNEAGNYVVTAVYPPAPANEGDSVALQEGRIVIMMHDSCADVDSYGFFTALTEGTVLTANTAWADMAATWSALDVEFTVAEDDGTTDDGTTDDGTTDDGTTDDGTTDDGTSDEEIKDTGDNFLPMFVLLFAGAALVVVAGKKRLA